MNSSAIIPSPNKNFRLNGYGWSNSDDAATLPRHRWYSVKEAFSPAIVDEAISTTGCKRGDVIIDPFCGSGTVPLVASLKDYRATAFEVNPFLSFVARTKMIPRKPQDFESCVTEAVNQAQQGRASALENYSSFSQATSKEKWLFNMDVLRSFEGGWNATLKMDDVSRNLLQLGLITAAMDNCNAEKDGKCLRYRKNWKTSGMNKESFLNTFTARMSEMGDDLDTCPNTSNKGEVIFGDARQVIPESVEGKFRLCVTSPPYLNSFDYSDIYRPELFLGKFVTSNEELAKIRMKTLRSHVQVNWESPTDSNFGPLYNEAIREISGRSDMLWNKRIPEMIQAYFQDIKKVLSDLNDVSHPDASIWMVVSTSAYAGVEIPVDLIIANIGTKVGWHLREVGVLRSLRSSGQHWKQWAGTEDVKPRLRESVVIFHKNPRKRKSSHPQQTASA